MAILCPPENPPLFKPLVFVEQISNYQLGGFHPISIGDSFDGGRYKVLNKLGDGASSTVWLARDSFEADVWELGCAIFEIRTGTELFSDYFGCPEDVLRQVVSMLGRLPDPWWEKFEYRSSWFTDDGEPKSMSDKFWEVQENGDITFLIPAKKTSIIEQLRLVGVKGDALLADEEVMYEKAGVGLSEKEVELLADLLGKMLKYCPEDRIGLREVLDHPWFGMSE